MWRKSGRTSTQITAELLESLFRVCTMEAPSRHIRRTSQWVVRLDSCLPISKLENSVMSSKSVGPKIYFRYVHNIFDLVYKEARLNYHEI